MTKIEAKRKRYKGLTMIVVLVLGAAIVVQVLLTVPELFQSMFPREFHCMSS